jgi:hypothetical protein
VGWAGQGECVDVGGPTLVDGEAAAEAVVTAAEAERTAWASLPALAAQSDTLVGGLRATAALVGVSTKEQGQLLSLCVDASGVHRRQVWAAWCSSSGTRASRWGALVRLGCRVRAHDLVGFEKYAMAQPMQEKTGRHGELVLVDPEDEEVAQTPATAEVLEAWVDAGHGLMRCDATR